MKTDEMLKAGGQVNVIEARPEDVGEIVLAIMNSSRHAARCFKKPSVELDELTSALEGEVIYLAEIGGRFVGFVSVWVPDHFIHHLYVLPEFQRRGIGSRLLEHCQREYGRALSLKCEISNMAAQRFYRSKGWVSMECGTGIDGPWERFYSPTE